MNRKWVIFIFFMAISTMLIAQNDGKPCICETPGLSEAVGNADLIFEGTLINKEPNWVSGGMKYSFKITQSWKTTCDKIRFVNSGWEADCGFLFQLGQPYLVYANKRHTNMKTHRCMGTKLLVDAKKDLELLGEGMPPEKPKKIVATSLNLLLVALASLAFLAFVVLKKNRNRKK